MSDDTTAPVPIVDRKTAALVLTKYHRFKGVLDDDQEAIVSHFQLDEDTEAADTALSDIYTLKITYQLPLEEHERDVNLIIKQLPQDPFARLFVKEAQFDVREINFYTKVSRVIFFCNCRLQNPQFDH